MAFNNLKYVIYPVADIGKIDFNCFRQNAPKDITDLDSIKTALRVDNNDANFILKYEGAKPRCIYGATVYDHETILGIVNDQNGDWWTDVEI